MIMSETRDQEPRWRLKYAIVQNLNFTVISLFVLAFNTVA